MNALHPPGAMHRSIFACALLAMVATPATGFMTGSARLAAPMSLRPATACAQRAGALRMADGPEPADLGLIKPLVEGNTEVERAFQFLQRTDYIQEREGYLMGEVIADGIIREVGFTEFAEKINGRIAQVAFIIGLGETFNGDILTQLAEHPVKAMILAGFITAASLPPVFDARTEDRRGIALFNSLVPVSVRDTALSLFSSTGADKIFTEKAELTNSRAAMAAIGVWLVLATLF